MTTIARIEPSHQIGIVAFDGLIAFDLTSAFEIFSMTRLTDGTRPYRVKVCSSKRTVRAAGFSIRTRWGLNALLKCDTIVIPGVIDIGRKVDATLVRTLQRAAHKRIRIVSICTGAFVLAEAGLLDHKSATTHWLAAQELQRAFPLVTVDANVLYVDEGAICTSAGAAAGLDLCLHLVRRDCGASVAAAAARCAVMPLTREGGQAQFIRENSHTVPELVPLLTWLESNLKVPLTLKAIAKRASMSTRTLSRRFQGLVGMTPMKWLVHARIRKAQQVLETSTDSVESVCFEVGFGSVASFRSCFRSIVGTSPQSYRRNFRN
jgi:transcriptional regulator GlxA family with amidase domain